MALSIDPLPPILVTGPARSGKSEWAEYLATTSGRTVTYVATAQLDPADAEWQQRIEQHRQRRPATWTTLAVPIALAETIQAATTQDCLLIDSLGTWLANLLDQDEATWAQICQTLLDRLQPACSGPARRRPTMPKRFWRGTGCSAKTGRSPPSGPMAGTSFFSTFPIH